MTEIEFHCKLLIPWLIGIPFAMCLEAYRQNRGIFWPDSFIVCLAGLLWPIAIWFIILDMIAKYFIGLTKEK